MILIIVLFKDSTHSSMEYYTSPIWFRHLMCSTKGRVRQQYDSSSSPMLNTRILGGKMKIKFLYVYMKCNVYIGMFNFFRVMKVNSCILLQHVKELNSALYF